MSCDVSEEDYTVHALHWLHEGAAIIGGCCGTTPAYIQALVEAVRARA